MSPRLRALPSRTAAITAAGLLLCAAVFSGCGKCADGYELIDDGTCYGEKAVASGELDTGEGYGAGDQQAMDETEVFGIVRQVDQDLSAASTVTVEFWSSKSCTIYGPNRTTHEPDRVVNVAVAELQANGSAEFSETVIGIPRRGREMLVWVAVKSSDGSPERFYEAEANPYILQRDIEPPLVEIALSESNLD